MSGSGAGARRLPMFPLGTVLFPGGVLPLHVFEPRYRRLMDDCLRGDRRFGVVLITRGSEVGGGDERVPVGTEANIEEATRLPDGRWVLIASGGRRIAVEAWLEDDPYPLAVVLDAVEGDPPSPEALAAAAAAVRRANALASELAAHAVTAEVPATDEGDPGALAWRLCDAAPLGPLDRQRLLSIDDPSERLSLLDELVTEVAADLRRLLAEGGPG